MLVYTPNSGRVLIPETESTHGGLDGSSSVTHTGSSELVFTHVPISWFLHKFFLSASFHTSFSKLEFSNNRQYLEFHKVLITGISQKLQLPGG